MLKVLITGSSGLIGSRVVGLLSSNYKFITVLHSQTDISDLVQARDAVVQSDFDICLHLAGYTQVDKAEVEVDKAEALNVKATQNLFNTVKDKGKKFIYISTDFVFDGKEKKSYDEDTKPNPISVYGQTKYAGEQVVGDQGMIVRIAYPYGYLYPKKLDFVQTISKLLAEGKQIKMVEDSLITPTFIDDLVWGLDYLLKHYKTGIYHLVGPESLSPYEVGLKIAKIFGYDRSLITPISYNEYFANKAKRPQYMQIVSKNNDFYKMQDLESGLLRIKSFRD